MFVKNENNKFYNLIHCTATVIFIDVNKKKICIRAAWNRLEQAGLINISKFLPSPAYSSDVDTTDLLAIPLAAPAS